jgi:hypothetical protein
MIAIFSFKSATPGAHNIKPLPILTQYLMLLRSGLISPTATSVYKEVYVLRQLSMMKAMLGMLTNPVVAFGTPNNSYGSIFKGKLNTKFFIGINYKLT